MVALPFGRISMSLSPDMLQVNGSELYDFQPVAEIEVRGLRKEYKRFRKPSERAVDDLQRLLGRLGRHPEGVRSLLVVDDLHLLDDGSDA